MNGFGRALLAIGVTALLTAGAALWFVLDNRADDRAHCTALNAKFVPTGHGHYLCIAPDGQVVGP